MNNKFKDYIACPKTNMYRSIHTTVFGPDNHLLQFQIKTTTMDDINTIGLANALTLIEMANEEEDESLIPEIDETLDNSTAVDALSIIGVVCPVMFLSVLLYL